MDKKAFKYKVEGTVRFDHLFVGVNRGEHFFAFSDWRQVGESQWRMKFRFPAKQDCSLFLEHSGPETEAEFTFKFISQIKGVPSFDRGPDTFTFHENDRGYMSVIPSDTLLSHSTGYLLRGTILVECLITTPPSVKKRVSSVTKDIGNLLLDESSSDFLIRTDSVDYPVHKNILSARSPVFKTMFQSSIQDSSINHMISDFSSLTVKKFLTFLYTDDCVLTDTTDTLELSRMASQYEVKGLLELSEEHLAGCITIESCIELLKFAHSHNNSTLKENVLHFIRDHGYVVVMKHESHLVESLGPVLTTEVMKRVTNPKEK